MTVALSPIGNGFQFFTASGIPLAGGLLNTYNAGGSTPTATYTTSAGNVQNANPIVLDAAGRPPSEIWLTDGTAYKFVLTDSNGANSLSYDNLTGIGNVLLGLTPQLASNNAFTGTNSFSQAVTMASTLAVSGISSTVADFKVTTAGHGILGPDGGRYLTINNSAVTVTGTLSVTSATSINDTANENVFNISPSNASFASTALTVNTTRDANTAFDFVNLKANSASQFKIGGTGVITVGTTGTSTVTKMGIYYTGGGVQYGIALRPVSDTTHAIEFERADGVSVGNINVTTTTTAYVTSSDRRLKDNVRNIVNFKTVLTDAVPVEFDWNHTRIEADKFGVGYIAQDFAKVLPVAVSVGDSDPELRPGDDGFRQWQLDKSFLIPYLHQGWLDHDERMNALRAEFDAYKQLHP